VEVQAVCHQNRAESVRRPDGHGQHGETQEAAHVVEGAHSQQHLLGEARQPAPPQAFHMREQCDGQRARRGRNGRGAGEIHHPARLSLHSEENQRTPQDQGERVHQALAESRGQDVSLAQRRTRADGEGPHQFPRAGWKKTVSQISRHVGAEHEADAQALFGVEQDAPPQRAQEKRDAGAPARGRQESPPRPGDGLPNALPIHAAQGEIEQNRGQRNGQDPRPGAAAFHRYAVSASMTTIR